VNQALAALRHRYDHRFPVESGSRQVIGYVGQDVPVELITASGAWPVRLAGRPGQDTSAGDKYLGRGLDEVTRSILTRLLAGEYGRLDGLVISRDCEGSLRLFYALRELSRVDPQPGLPEVYLVDLLHLPHRSTARYNLVRVAQLRDRLGLWTGGEITDERVADAIASHDENRALLAEIRLLRAQSRLSGRDALAVYGAGTVLPVQEHTASLRQLLEGDLPQREGTRIFLTGSSHDAPEVYDELEGGGALIVGEDHDWGDLLTLRQVGAPTITALTERYQYNGPTAQRASIVDRAATTTELAAACRADLVVAYFRQLDEAPPWDFPAQRDALHAVGIKAVALEHQAYGAITEVLT
jgi:benzoyl-CoA reductase/2-hydroxyglutaryl-CoA dehydratase subunit BcrC/BadD/HgdB